MHARGGGCRACRINADVIPSAPDIATIFITAIRSGKTGPPIRWPPGGEALGGRDDRIGAFPATSRPTTDVAMVAGPARIILTCPSSTNPYRPPLSSRRLLKAAEAIREVVAQAILTELRDPRVKDVTVVGVSVSPDMREAKVAVSVMGDEKQQNLSLRGLQNSAGFLQSKIAQRIDTRYTPRLQFSLDKGQHNAMVVGELLAKIRREQQDDSDDDGADDVDTSPSDDQPTS